MTLTAVVGAMAIVTGCGESRRETFPVRGTVTFKDGQPLAGGVVEFQSIGAGDEQINARGEIQADGTYRLTTYEEADGAVAGRHQVIVLPPVDTTGSNMSGPPPPEVLHRRFQSYETSGLEFTVQPGENQYPIVVDRPG
jgi:hypothetical protein